jgi:putative transposase
MDWHSRYVLSWEVSVTMEEHFCVNALESALRRYPPPEIFNTDQGSQYTGKAFTGRLKDHAITISMDGRGRAMDNIMVERLWRSVKYEEVYLKEYLSVTALIEGLRHVLLFIIMNAFTSGWAIRPRRKFIGTDQSGYKKPPEKGKCLIH